MTTKWVVKSIFCLTNSVNKYYFQLQPEKKIKQNINQLSILNYLREQATSAGSSWEQLS